MDKKDVKSLLKRRNDMVYMHGQFDGTCISDDANRIYKEGKEQSAGLIFEIDLQLIEYVKSNPVGIWLMNINAMTVDIAAGLIAYFDITGKDRAAQFISFAGVDNREHPYNENAAELINKITARFFDCENSIYGKLGRNALDNYVSNNLPMHVAEIKAKRYVSKLFISHLFEEMYREENNELPARHDDTNSIIIEPEVPYTK